MTQARKPNLGLLVIRVVVITILAALLTFAMALFLGITGIVLVDMIRGGGINPAAAYRHVALPIAIAALVIGFVVTLFTEIRYYRRAIAAARAGYSRAA